MRGTIGVPALTYNASPDLQPHAGALFHNVAGARSGGQYETPTQSSDCAGSPMSATPVSDLMESGTGLDLHICRIFSAGTGVRFARNCTN
jgi:hypothetical protein